MSEPELRVPTQGGSSSGRESESEQTQTRMESLRKGSLESGIRARAERRERSHRGVTQMG